jgi:membrane protein required for colicin V production
MNPTPFMTDAIVLGIIFFSAVLALTRGFIREVLTLVSLGGAILIAVLLRPHMQYLFDGWLQGFQSCPNAAEGEEAVCTNPIAVAAAASALFFGSLILLSIMTHFIAKLFKGAGLGWVDRLLGLAFGALRGAVLVILGYIFVSYLFPVGEQPEWLDRAWTRPYMDSGKDGLTALLPELANPPAEAAPATPEEGEGTAGDAQMTPETPAPEAASPDGSYSPDQTEDMDRYIEEMLEQDPGAQAPAGGTAP